MPAPIPDPVVFFDGVCGLCNGFVDFLLARDRKRVFRFATLQGETAASLLREEAASAPLDPADPAAADPLRSVLLRDEKGLHRRSEAALRSLARLGGIWAVARILLAIPRPLRDLLYDFIARNRYRWFGRRETCRLPSPEERARFLP